MESYTFFLLVAGCCHIMLTPRLSEGVMVIRFQEDQVARNDSMAWYDGGIDPTRELVNVTLCGRFFLFTHHGRVTFFMLTNDLGEDAMLEGDVWVNRVRPVLAGNYNFQLLKEKLWAFRWHHLCFVYDKLKQRISTYMDGNLNNHQENVDLLTISGSGAKIGQGLHHYLQRSLSGDLTQVNVWDRPLSAEEVRNMAECKEDPQGNYVSWNAGWRIENANSYEMPLSDFCKRQEGVIYYWFPNKPFKTSLYLCRALGSRLPLATDPNEVQEMFDISHSIFLPKDNCYTDHWTALNDIKNEGVWRVDDTVIEDVPWAPYEPNGLQYENCVSYGPFGPWDVNCNTNIKCIACLFKEQHRFSLLGTCESELRNVYFMVFQNKVNKLLFTGYGSYRIREENSVWKWVTIAKNQTIATLEDKTTEYPMGRRWWRLEHPVCGQQSGGMRQLLFTPCSQDEFTCNDATCVPLPYRCDLKYDCRDNSDEVDCKIVAFPVGYQKHLPPRNETNSKASLGLAASFIVESMSVRTLDMVMEVSYMMELTWVDFRLSYLNLKSNVTLNIVPMETVQKLWTPDISFTNTRDNKHSIIDADTTMSIIRQGKPVGRDEEAPAEVDIYAGGGNTLRNERKYGTVFTCNLDLVLYPFDTQECFMRFRMTSASKSLLVFDQAKSAVLNEANKMLVEYEVGSLRLVFSESRNGFSEVSVLVPLTRRYGYAILNIYIPTLVLLIVNYVTLFFRPIIFDVRMMAALTVQLVIATLFSQVSQSLPKTAYFKMVDVWFIFCITITFITIIFHVLVDEAVQPSSPSSAITKVSPTSPTDKVFTILGAEVKDGPVRILSGMTTLLQGNRTVVATKLTVLIAFMLFNICYWGYILF